MLYDRHGVANSNTCMLQVILPAVEKTARPKLFSVQYASILKSSGSPAQKWSGTRGMDHLLAKRDENSQISQISDSIQNCDFFLFYTLSGRCFRRLTIVGHTCSGQKPVAHSRAEHQLQCLLWLPVSADHSIASCSQLCCACTSTSTRSSCCCSLCVCNCIKLSPRHVGPGAFSLSNAALFAILQYVSTMWRCQHLKHFVFQQLWRVKYVSLVTQCLWQQKRILLPFSAVLRFADWIKARQREGAVPEVRIHACEVALVLSLRPDAEPRALDSRPCAGKVEAHAAVRIQQANLLDLQQAHRISCRSADLVNTGKHLNHLCDPTLLRSARQTRSAGGTFFPRQHCCHVRQSEA